MAKNSTRYLESDATDEENSHDYIVEWDDELGEWNDETKKYEHLGPGSKYFSHDYDNAWDYYCTLKDLYKFKNVRLRTVN